MPEARDQNIELSTATNESDTARAERATPGRAKRDDVNQVVDEFIALRERYWPRHPTPHTSRVSLAAQALGWLQEGLCVDEILEVVEVTMEAAARDGKDPPNSLRVYDRSLRRAADRKAGRGAGDDAGGGTAAGEAGGLPWWQDTPHPEIAPLTEAFRQAKDDPDRRAELARQIRDKEAEIAARSAAAG